MFAYLELRCYQMNSSTFDVVTTISTIAIIRSLRQLVLSLITCVQFKVRLDTTTECNFFYIRTIFYRASKDRYR